MLLDWFWLFFDPVESCYILMHLFNLVLVLVMRYFLWTWALLMHLFNLLLVLVMRNFLWTWALFRTCLELSTWVKQECKIFSFLSRILPMILLFILLNLFFERFGMMLLLIITHLIIAAEFPRSKTTWPLKWKSFCIITLLLHLVIVFSLNH